MCKDRNKISAIWCLDKAIQTVFLASTKSQIVVFINEIGSIFNLQVSTNYFWR